MRNAFSIVFLLSMAVWTQSARQAATERKSDPKQTQMPVWKTYDLRDYLLSPGNYPLPPARESPATQPVQILLLPSPGINNVDPRESFTWGTQFEMAGEKACGIEALLEAQIAPDTWLDNGGSFGAIAELNGIFFIRQTPAAQEQVRQLLAHVTAGTNRTVRISATWLLLSHDQLVALRDPAHAADETKLQLDDQALQRAKSFARGQILCIAGETVSLIGQPERSASGPAAQQFELQVRPILGGSDQQVFLDVLNVVKPLEATTHPSHFTRVGDAAGSDAGQQFHTTAHIPLGVDVVVGSISADSSLGAKGGRELYLVLRVDAAK